MEEKKAEATLIIPEKKKDQPIADFLNEQLNEAMPGIIDAAARDMVSQIVSSRFIAEAIVQKLNEINELDSSVLPKLINYRVRCNDKFANHPTIQVGQANYPPGYQVGFLGILNGLIGVKTDDWGYVAADMNPDGSIKRFLILEDKQR